MHHMLCEGRIEEWHTDQNRPPSGPVHLMPGEGRRGQWIAEKGPLPCARYHVGWWRQWRTVACRARLLPLGPVNHKLVEGREGQWLAREDWLPPGTVNHRPSDGLCTVVDRASSQLTSPVHHRPDEGLLTVGDRASLQLMGLGHHMPDQGCGGYWAHEGPSWYFWSVPELRCFGSDVVGVGLENH